MENYIISVIVPVYNTEKYIEKCARSLFEQDFDSIEYIFINDACQDNSIDILFSIIEEYHFRKPHIRYINNLNNRGAGYCRKQGLIASSGQYVIQIDSDDWVELDMCSQLYQVVSSSKDVDIIVCDFYENFLYKEIYINQPYTEDSWIDFKQILIGNVHGSLCNKLIKRSLYINNNIFPLEELNFYEDKMTTLLLFYKAEKIVYLSKAFLHYRKHNLSMTSNVVAERHIRDTIIFINSLVDFFYNENLLESNKDILRSCILYHKKIFMLDSKYYPYWDSIYNEVNKIKYVWGIKSYNWKKKLIMIASMIFSKKIMQIAYFYNKERGR